MANRKPEIIEYLADQGLRPKDQPYGISFNYQMLNYVIRYDEDDDQFLQIVLPGIFDVNADNRVDALEAANVVNDQRKVVKCVVLDDTVWVLAEQLLDSTPDYDDILPRAINMLQQAREAFYEALRAL